MSINRIKSKHPTDLSDRVSNLEDTAVSLVQPLFIAAHSMKQRESIE